MDNKKFKLDNLKIKSFVIEMEASKGETVKGGGSWICTFQCGTDTLPVHSEAPCDIN